MEAGSMWRLGHRPELDALRGVAILLVILGHTYVGAIGPAGVAVFFTLSGFLITSLLLEEIDHTGRIDVAAFYRRRAVRLLPALVVFLAVTTTAGLLLTPVIGSPTNALRTLFYVRNWFADYDATDHTWSLAVEEQFYLVFPLLMIVVARRVTRRWLLAVVLTLVVASMAMRFVVHPALGQDFAVYRGSDSNAGLLLLGAAVAIWRSCSIGSLPRPRTALVVLAVALAGAPFMSWPTASAWLPPIASTATAVMLVLVTGGAPGSLPSWCSPALLVLAGRRSYALYLWHLPLLLLVTPHVILVRPLLPHTVLLFPLALVAAWGVTLLSWRYVEEPALRWRRRLVATADCSAQPSARRLRELAESG